MTGGAGPGDSDDPSITIRPAKHDDLAAVGRLGALLVQVHYEYDPRRFMAPTPETESLYAAFLATQRETPNVVILVAVEQGEVIGYAYADVEGPDYMSLRGPAGVLHDILVHPDHRGRGVGRRLLESALAALAARGAPRFVLSTAARNEGAHRLFARAGFRPTMIEMTREVD